MREFQQIEEADDPVLAFVESAPEHTEFEDTPRRWDAFDTALCGAIMLIAKGPTKAELVLYQERRTRTGLQVSGRAALWHLLHRHKLDHGQALHVDLTMLMKLEFKVDLEVYLNALDGILMGLAKPPDEELLHALVEPQLRKCKALAPDFVSYGRAADGAEERTSKHLYDCARRFCARRRREETLAAMTKDTKVMPIG